MKRITREQLKKIGISGALISGLLLAANSFGWNPEGLLKTKNVHENEAIYPKNGIVESVIDGDNLVINNGQSVRLIGINAPERGKENFDKAKEKLDSLTTGKKVYLEYDREDDGQFGRLMAWAWVDCESEPNFLPWDYMRLSYNKSRPGLTENPEGCQEGKLIQEEMVKAGLAKILNYKGRAKLKYEERIKSYEQ
ncbi:hypothetical protein COW80_04910 [Candidatus Beckwithbacteria bacterium CG22_combo_CG10-13_8_21_14_all_01_47_9]|uniref:TNase-like domain-containing protein n=2 Tax=Candidatus Beckwithiibacteriota TaxID=1752726 RepID=A0A2H0DZK5_9BACT|nr:MAG: hypothetical protein COW80_04910 [Candidatus Beckwithbacteria bacterium CG22_combo_CG10-13_8_21_14_all_01_47_9]PJC66730.1 MAG: hypothetical protein CO018_00430 [Candidatus Beckwithbacteria bacterium CG_4_9_14_0_2_um_filter_47_11]